MKAVRLHEIGGPQNLLFEEVDRPRPGPGEIVVRVQAAAFNHRDVFITQGLYPNISLPRTLGSDGAGVVAELGAGVEAPAVGTPVVIDPMLDWGDDPAIWGPNASILGMPHEGTFAQYVCVPAQNVYARPAHLTIEEAAALPLAGLTAYRAAFTRAAIRGGETLLVTGVGGGVQTFVLLFAKQAGLRVVATSSSDDKLARASALGADVVVNYKSMPDWHKAVRKAVGTVDVVIDSTGGETFARALSLVRPGGRVVTYGGTTGDATIKMFPVFWNHLNVMGTSMGSPWDFRALLAFVEETKLRPVVDRVFPMEQAVQAARHLDGAHQFGKVVLAIS